MGNVVVGINEFNDGPMARIREIAAGWAECVRIDESADAEAYRAALKDARVMCGWVKPPILAASQVEFFQCGNTGWEPYAVPELLEKPGFVMCTSRGVMSIPVAEHAIGMMFALTRHIHQHAQDQAQKRWQRHPPYLEVTGKTACVLGLGAIGQEIAKRCVGLGMNVIGVARRPDGVDQTHVSKCYAAEKLYDALSEADHAMIALPLTSQTRRLFNRDTFAAMKPGAFIYNVTRGDIIDVPAIIEAIQSGRLAGAGLDSHTVTPLDLGSPLWELPNVLITPHVAGRSVHEWDRQADLFARNLRAFRDREPLENVVIHNSRAKVASS